MISSTSMQRAEQIMSQTATKENYDPFEDDDVDDDELCRVNWFISFFFIMLYDAYLLGMR